MNEDHLSEYRISIIRGKRLEEVYIFNTNHGDKFDNFFGYSKRLRLKTIFMNLCRTVDNNDPEEDFTVEDFDHIFKIIQHMYLRGLNTCIEIKKTIK